MSDFPRTQIENLSVPRMLIGTNWFLGFSHQSCAKDRHIKAMQTPERIADILEVFFNAGIDCLYGARPESSRLEDAVRDAEDRTGRKCIKMGTPHFDLSGPTVMTDENRRVVDGFAEIGCDVCLPHQSTTDSLVDKVNRRINGGEDLCAMIRERGMIPGFSTHMPEVPVYADEQGLDVGTYIQIYNAAGFLMQIEIDWVQRMIWQREKPVITIKPFAAGRLHPLVGLGFGWATLRQQDMICVGAMTPDEARELIEISCALFDKRPINIDLQTTRSKKSITG